MAVPYDSGVGGSKMRSRALLPWIALVAAIALGLPAVASAAGGGGSGSKRPDLIVTRAKLLDKLYAFSDDSGLVHQRSTTKNREGFGRPRQASQTALVLTAANAGEDLEIVLARRRIGKLGPGDAHTGDANETVNGGRLKPGAYAMRICADVDEEVREANEHNNCKDVPTQGGLFYVSKRHLSGTLSGSGRSPGGLSETWQSDDVHYDFSEYLIPGLFIYAFSGSVTWTISGEEPAGCTWNGTGTDPITNSTHGLGLQLDWNSHAYYGESSAIGFEYEIGSGGQETCVDSEQVGPYHRGFWEVPPGERGLLSFGSIELNDSRTDLSGAVFHWNFH